MAAAGRLTGFARAGALVGLATLLAAHAAAQEPARPIRIGALSTLSGPSSFPESSQAAKAYFDAVNAAGGIRGRRIQYLSADDRGDPRAAAAAAAQMLADPEVVALAGVSLSAQDWRHLMRDAGLPLSSLSQGGYLSAQLLVRALRRIDGPITRASVTAALRGLPPVEHVLVGMPLAIGAAAHHNPNRAAMPLKHEGGSWRIAATRWIEVPPVSDREAKPIAPYRSVPCPPTRSDPCPPTRTTMPAAPAR
jgi:hypothetical protein